MANTNAPFGFRSVSRIDGGTVGRLKSEYNIADQLASNIGLGDLVIVTGSSAPAADPRYAGPLINKFAQGTNVTTGVFQGCAYQDNLGNFIWSKNWVSGTVTQNALGAQAFVEDDPQIVFEVQASLGFAVANIRSFAKVVTTATPNTLGISQETLDSSNIVTALDTLKILKLSPRPGNSFGNYAVAYVFLAKHELRDPQVQL
jgi:hypothetical protein